jgi:hypothetical protein
LGSFFNDINGTPKDKDSKEYRAFSDEEVVRIVEFD